MGSVHIEKATKPVAVVDLFAGPGGLAEGFSACLDSHGRRRYEVKLSVEKDTSAHRTLLLRAFLRKFKAGCFPQKYYDFLNGAIPEPNWKSLFPKKWRDAERETQCLELGGARTHQVLQPAIDKIRDEYGERTVLIGGPPCQAYSLVGRSRINGAGSCYAPDNDPRLYLYRQYVKILKYLKPMIAVMENVPGILSSTVQGERIFPEILERLCNAGGPDNYRLFPLVPRSSGLDLGGIIPEDFIVRAEEHGIPQARHRVFVVCLRRDVADSVPDGCFPWLKRYTDIICVEDVIGGMPRLRSGLSRSDDPSAWRDALLHAFKSISQHMPKLSGNDKALFCKALARAKKIANSSTPHLREDKGSVALTEGCPLQLCNWLYDTNVKRLPNNYTRGHMPTDLTRYLFASIYSQAIGRSPKSADFPSALAPDHKNWNSGAFADRYRVQVADRPATTITSHISKDGHYFIHPDPSQCRSLTVREAARLQTFPDNYLFTGNRTQQYVQVGNAVPPYLAYQIAESLWKVLEFYDSKPNHSEQEGAIVDRAENGMYSALGEIA